MTTPRKEFGLTDIYVSIEDRLTHWRDWEVARFATYLSDLEQAKKDLAKRPSPRDCAGTYALTQIDDAINTVGAALAKSKASQPPVEEARQAALDACAILNSAHDSVANAPDVESLIQAQAAVTIGQRDQLRLWSEFERAATAARLPLVSTLPLHGGRHRHRQANRLDDITASRGKARFYEIGYHNPQIEVASNHATDAGRDPESFVWDVVEMGHHDRYRTDDAIDVLEVFCASALRKMGLPFDEPQIFETDAAE